MRFILIISHFLNRDDNLYISINLERLDAKYENKSIYSIQRLL